MDVGGDALEGHDSGSAGLLGDVGVLGCEYVHDHATTDQTFIQINISLSIKIKIRFLFQSD